MSSPQQDSHPMGYLSTQHPLLLLKAEARAEDDLLLTVFIQNVTGRVVILPCTLSPAPAFPNV